MFQNDEGNVPERPIERPAGRPVDRPVGRPIERPVIGPIVRPVVGPVKKLAGKPMNKRIGRSLEGLIERPAERTASRLILRPLARSRDRPIEKPSSKPPADKQARKSWILIKRRHFCDKLKPYLPPLFREQFRTSRKQMFRAEWDRIQSFCHDVYRSFERGVKGPEEEIRVPVSTVIIAHDDMHILLRSKAGRFMFDFVSQKVLRDSTQILYQSILDITREERENALVVLEPYDVGVNRNFSLELLTLAWRHFYFDILPELHSVFFDVSERSFMSIRLAALLAFRDIILRRVQGDLLEILEDQNRIKPEIVFLRQMVLLLQISTEKCPIPECTFDLDVLVPPVVEQFFPYLYPHWGLLDAGDVDPECSSSYNDSDDDDDTYSLPLCTLSSPGAETQISELSSDEDFVTDPGVAVKATTEKGGGKEDGIGKQILQAYEANRAFMVSGNLDDGSSCDGDQEDNADD